MPYWWQPTCAAAPRSLPLWNASTGADADRLRSDMRVMPDLAEDGALTAAKDISMAGVVGTAMMLAEASSVGCTIDLGRLPKPKAVPLECWLTAFPSFGFVMTTRPDRVADVIRAFQQCDIACAAVGTIDDSRTLTIEQDDEHAQVWDFARPLIGCRRDNAIIAEVEGA